MDGVVITGGEPLIWFDLPDFLRRIRSLGYKIKLDTNGSFPERLKTLLDFGLVDYVAMDIKHTPQQYADVCGMEQKKIISKIEQSLNVLAGSGISFELRTTVVKGIHTLEDMTAIAKWIGGLSAYYLQSYVNSENIISPKDLSSFSPEELEEILLAVKCYCPTAILRK